MKKILLCLFCIAFYGNTNAQPKVVDFSSAMTSAPIGKKRLVMHVIYENGRFSAVKERLVKSRKPTKSITHNYVLMGKIIDSLKLIDYMSDTVYILTEYSLVTSSSFEIYKTTKDTFYLVKDEQKKYQIRYVDMDKDYSVWEQDQKISDSILYKAIFSWNIDKLIQLIKSSGVPSENDYQMSATRIVLKNNQIISEEVIYFKPSIRWEIGNTSD